jgi:hypothetical protein
MSEYQLNSEVQNETKNTPEEVQETKFLNRFSTFHQSFVGRKSFDRTKKSRHTINGSNSQTYQTRANYSRGNFRSEPLRLRSSNINRENKNQAQVQKV